eukprot:CAMPEP_0118671874 /NCGR_PEP_ID=MMETSP0785-20121206/22236_1 /TAXON_ID=91992 /ORGANISM="Bolidomonas pacifica, Strain CCMP 1866" /LENGTH=96 /DNA_ID=CAMNT_0006566791 /DNA_START=361 /DNA_END=651 /DNA_ORIENTATION=+
MILVEYEGLQGVPARGLQVLHEVFVIVPEVVAEVAVRSFVNEEVAAVTGLGETKVLSVYLHQPRAVRAGLLEHQDIRVVSGIAKAVVFLNELRQQE